MAITFISSPEKLSGSNSRVIRERGRGRELTTAKSLARRVKANLISDQSSAEDQIAVSMVPRILSSLDPSYHGFTRASQMYNAEFFEGESQEFRIALVRALKQTYPRYPNSYWDKVLVTEQINLNGAPEPILTIATQAGAN